MDALGEKKGSATESITTGSSFMSYWGFCKLFQSHNLMLFISSTRFKETKLAQAYSK